MKLLCKLFGHKLDLVEVTLMKIKQVAENKEELKHELICKRCGEKVFWRVRLVDNVGG